MSTCREQLRRQLDELVEQQNEYMLDEMYGAAEELVTEIDELGRRIDALN
jgi:hypothetical protein